MPRTNSNMPAAKPLSIPVDAEAQLIPLALDWVTAWLGGSGIFAGHLLRCCVLGARARDCVFEVAGTKRTGMGGRKLY